MPAAKLSTFRETKSTTCTIDTRARREKKRERERGSSGSQEKTKRVSRNGISGNFPDLRVLETFFLSPCVSLLRASPPGPRVYSSPLSLFHISLFMTLSHSHAISLCLSLLFRSFFSLSLYSLFVARAARAHSNSIILPTLYFRPSVLRSPSSLCSLRVMAFSFWQLSQVKLEK